MPGFAGRLILAGGSENRDPHNGQPLDVLRALRQENLVDPLIEIITTASSEPWAYERQYQAALPALGFDRIGFMHVETKEQVEKNGSFYTRLEKADAVFFSGGDQAKLGRILGDTKLVDLLKARLHNDNNFTLGGTSAGAMIMAGTMIAGETQTGDNAPALNTGQGFAILKDIIIDSHFAQRNRHWRLEHALRLYPRLSGLGLDEDTGLVITGNQWRCIGSGKAWLYTMDETAPRMHVMAPGETLLR
ncbi:MAG: cyanophycinase [Alphaproteobacteria bacterium]|nr:cyanophycinase [Alphaproteobacteria bacterium]